MKEQQSTFAKVLRLFPQESEINTSEPQLTIFPTFTQVFREFNQRDAIESKHSAKTQSKYSNFCDNLEKFLSERDGAGILINNVRPPLIQDFHLWLKTKLKSCSNTHASKHIERCKKVMDYAVTKELITHNTIRTVKTKRDSVKDIIHLTAYELTKLINYEFQSRMMQICKDLYLFQISTGLSYGDLWTFQVHTDEMSGITWIEGYRNKKCGGKGKPYYVPISEKDFVLARGIHQKYNGMLPKLANGTYNRILKEMAALLGIDKKLTTHTGRKTFATLMDQNGWGITSLSRMMGNTEKVCRERYVNITRKTIEVEVSKRA